MKRVEVKWRDIRSDDGWHDANDMDDFVSENNSVVTQLGYLVEDDEEQIVLLDSYFLDKQLFGGIHKIPKGCVISMTEI